MIVSCFVILETKRNTRRKKVNHKTAPMLAILPTDPEMRRQVLNAHRRKR